MKNRLENYRTTGFVLLFVYSIMCTFPLSSKAQIDMTRVYFIGDSYTAGFMHGSMYEGFQQCSYPALIAEHLGFRLWDDFAMPRYSYPGVPGVLILQQAFPFPLFLRLGGQGENLTINDPRIYNNLAIPGASTSELFIESTENDDESIFFSTILRGRGSVLDQIEQVRPDMTFIWIGINETSRALALGFVWPDLTVTPPSVFEHWFSQAIQRVRNATSGPIVVIDIPDTTLTPFCHALPPYVVDLTTGQPVRDAQGRPVPLLGPDGPIPPETCVFQRALPWIFSGWGIPPEYGGNGLPLPSTVLFTPNEINAVRDLIRRYNAIIDSWANRLPDVHVFHFSSIFESWALNGIRIGGVNVNWEFPTGGFWAYDMFHPGPLGHALIANELISFLNETFSYDIPPLNILPILQGKRCGLAPLLQGQVNRPDHISLSVGAEWIPR